MTIIENSSRRSFLRQAFGAGALVLGARILPTRSSRPTAGPDRCEKSKPGATSRALARGSSSAIMAKAQAIAARRSI